MDCATFTLSRKITNSVKINEFILNYSVNTKIE